MQSATVNARLSRRDVIGLLAVASRRGAIAQQQSLYLLSGSPQPHTDLRFPAVLFRLGSPPHTVAWSVALITADQAVDYVLYSFEGRHLVAAGPKAVADRVAVVSFDAPGTPSLIKLDLGGWSVVRRHLVWLNGQLCLALDLRNHGNKRFLSIGVKNVRIQELPPAKLYHRFAIDGVPGLAANTDKAWLEKPADSRNLNVIEDSPGFASGIVLPESISLPPQEPFFLVAQNSDVAVITAGLRTGPTATTPLLVLDQKRGVWKTIEAPGGGSQVRAFGPWLAIYVLQIRREHQASPGQRRRERPSLTGPAFDMEARDRQVYAPGLVYLYHVPTGRRIIKDTGQGDTEVLWVETDRVLYRCDRTLYEAPIMGGALGEPRTLIEQDFVADVHWAFYGPASDPPPAPWQAFDDSRK